MADQSWKPADMQSVIPYFLCSPGKAKDLIAFAAEVLGAVETSRDMRPNGDIMHASMRLNECTIMLGDSPDAQLTPSRMGLYIYLPDVDSVYRRAIEAGAKSRMEPADQPYGDRGAGFEDPFGNTWWLGQKLTAG